MHDDACFQCYLEQLKQELWEDNASQSTRPWRGHQGCDCQGMVCEAGRQSVRGKYGGVFNLNLIVRNFLSFKC